MRAVGKWSCPPVAKKQHRIFLMEKYLFQVCFKFSDSLYLLRTERFQVKTWECSSKSNETNIICWDYFVYRYALQTIEILPTFIQLNGISIWNTRSSFPFAEVNCSTWRLTLGSI